MSMELLFLHSALTKKGTKLQSSTGKNKDIKKSKCSNTPYSPFLETQLTLQQNGHISSSIPVTMQP